MVVLRDAALAAGLSAGEPSGGKYIERATGEYAQRDACSLPDTRLLQYKLANKVLLLERLALAGGVNLLETVPTLAAKETHDADGNKDGILKAATSTDGLLRDILAKMAAPGDVYTQMAVYMVASAHGGFIQPVKQMALDVGLSHVVFLELQMVWFLDHNRLREAYDVCVQLPRIPLMPLVVKIFLDELDLYNACMERLEYETATRANIAKGTNIKNNGQTSDSLLSRSDIRMLVESKLSFSSGEGLDRGKAFSKLELMDVLELVKTMPCKDAINTVLTLKAPSRSCNLLLSFYYVRYLVGIYEHVPNAASVVEELVQDVTPNHDLKSFLVFISASSSSVKSQNFALDYFMKLEDWELASQLYVFLDQLPKMEVDSNQKLISKKAMDERKQIGVMLRQYIGDSRWRLLAESTRTVDGTDITTLFNSAARVSARFMDPRVFATLVRNQNEYFLERSLPDWIESYYNEYVADNNENKMMFLDVAYPKEYEAISIDQESLYEESTIMEPAMETDRSILEPSMPVLQEEPTKEAGEEKEVAATTTNVENVEPSSDESVNVSQVLADELVKENDESKIIVSTANASAVIQTEPLIDADISELDAPVEENTFPHQLAPAAESNNRILEFDEDIEIMQQNDGKSVENDEEIESDDGIINQSMLSEADKSIRHGNIPMNEKASPTYRAIKEALMKPTSPEKFLVDKSFTNDIKMKMDISPIVSNNQQTIGVHQMQFANASPDAIKGAISTSLSPMSMKGKSPASTVKSTPSKKLTADFINKTLFGGTTLEKKYNGQSDNHWAVAESGDDGKHIFLTTPTKLRTQKNSDDEGEQVVERGNVSIMTETDEIRTANGSPVARLLEPENPISPQHSLVDEANEDDDEEDNANEIKSGLSNSSSLHSISDPAELYDAIAKELSFEFSKASDADSSLMSSESLEDQSELSIEEASLEADSQLEDASFAETDDMHEISKVAASAFLANPPPPVRNQSFINKINKVFGSERSRMAAVSREDQVEPARRVTSVSEGMSFSNSSKLSALRRVKSKFETKTYKKMMEAKAERARLYRIPEATNDNDSIVSSDDEISEDIISVQEPSAVVEELEAGLVGNEESFVSGVDSILEENDEDALEPEIVETAAVESEVADTVDLETNVKEVESMDIIPPQDPVENTVVDNEDAESIETAMDNTIGQIDEKSIVAAVEEITPVSDAAVESVEPVEPAADEKIEDVAVEQQEELPLEAELITETIPEDLITPSVSQSVSMVDLAKETESELEPLESIVEESAADDDRMMVSPAKPVHGIPYDIEEYSTKQPEQIEQIEQSDIEVPLEEMEDLEDAVDEPQPEIVISAPEPPVEDEKNEEAEKIDEVIEKEEPIEEVMMEDAVQSTSLMNSPVKPIVEPAQDVDINELISDLKHEPGLDDRVKFASESRIKRKERKQKAKNTLAQRNRVTRTMAKKLEEESKDQEEEEVEEETNNQEEEQNIEEEISKTVSPEDSVIFIEDSVVEEEERQNEEKNDVLPAVEEEAPVDSELANVSLMTASGSPTKTTKSIHDIQRVENSVTVESVQIPIIPNDIIAQAAEPEIVEEEKEDVTEDMVSPTKEVSEFSPVKEAPAKEEIAFESIEPAATTPKQSKKSSWNSRFFGLSLSPLSPFAKRFRKNPPKNRSPAKEQVPNEAPVLELPELNVETQPILDEILENLPEKQELEETELEEVESANASRVEETAQEKDTAVTENVLSEQTEESTELTAQNASFAEGIGSAMNMSPIAPVDKAAISPLAERVSEDEQVDDENVSKTEDMHSETHEESDEQLLEDALMATPTKSNTYKNRRVGKPIATLQTESLMKTPEAEKVPSPKMVKEEQITETNDSKEAVMATPAKPSGEEEDDSMIYIMDSDEEDALGIKRSPMTFTTPMKKTPARPRRRKNKSSSNIMETPMRVTRSVKKLQDNVGSTYFQTPAKGEEPGSAGTIRRSIRLAVKTIDSKAIPEDLLQNKFDEFEEQVTPSRGPKSTGLKVVSIKRGTAPKSKTSVTKVKTEPSEPIEPLALTPPPKNETTAETPASVVKSRSRRKSARYLQQS